MNNEIDCLIDIVDNGYTLNIAKGEYTLDEQLDALGQLGQSKNPKALAYVTEIAIERDWGFKEGGSTGYTDEILIDHPNAVGELRGALSSSSYAALHQYAGSDSPSDPHASLILRKALTQLRKDLGK